MIVDAVDPGSSSVRDCDVCIVGAGAAGITLASRLDRTKLRVIVLEGGGLEPDLNSQSLYNGSNVGRHYYDLAECRLRYFGGTTNHWSGWCRPFAASDFIAKPWIPHSGWPIGLSDLAPFYGPASDACDLKGSNFGPEILDGYDTAGSSLLETEFFDVKAFRFSPPTRFGTKFREQLQRSENVQVLLNANVTSIQANEARTKILSVDGFDLKQKKFSIRSKVFVLAAGGIENPRLLMHSRLGNDNDLVGRFFMDHPEPAVGVILTLNPNDARWRPFVYDLPGRDELQPCGAFVVSEQMQASNKILGCGFGLEYSPSWESPAGVGLRQLPEHLATGRIRSVGRDVWAVLSDLQGAADDRRLDLHESELPLMSFSVHCFGQQAPNPESRVTLSDERDSLGVPKVKLNWQLTDFDRHSLRRSLELFGQAIGSRGLGRLRLDFDGFAPDFQYGFHHMGTTRMSGSPATGVVDGNCQVHGIENLFVAGSSVFATSSSSPPTLTIVALAMRLAEHLKASS